MIMRRTRIADELGEDSIRRASCMHCFFVVRRPKKKLLCHLIHTLRKYDHDDPTRYCYHKKVFRARPQRMRISLSRHWSTHAHRQAVAEPSKILKWAKRSREGEPVAMAATGQRGRVVASLPLYIAHLESPFATLSLLQCTTP